MPAKKAVVILGVIAALLVCVQIFSGAFTAEPIPEFTITVKGKAAERLKTLSPIHIEEASFLFGACHAGQAGMAAYYVTGRDTVMHDTRAYWSCSLLLASCPSELSVRLGLQADAAVVYDVSGSTGQYNRDRVELCARLALKDASSELRVTPDHVEDAERTANLASWE